MGEPSYLYENPKHNANLNNVRLTEKFCDVTIKVEGREIRAHKVILAANLKYFETMFLNSFQEREQDVITMENVIASNLEALITYAYTGEIVLTDSNALGLLEVANYLSEDAVKKACIDFLKKHLKQEEACQAYQFANAIDCFSLKHIAKSTILSNFKNCSQTIGFFDLDFDCLKDILSSASLEFVESDQILFESTVRWIVNDVENRREHVNDLLNFIDMTKLPADWLLKYLCANVEDQDSTGIIEDIMKYYNKTTQEPKHDRKSRQYLVVIDKIKGRKNQCHIQLCDLSEIKYYTTTNYGNKKWSRPHDFTVFNSEVANMCTVVLKNKLYSLIKASLDHETHLRVFNPTTKQSEVLSYDRRLLICTAMCACTKYLYFCGGWAPHNYTTALDQVLKYDSLMKSFETLPPMGNPRANAAAIFHEGCLYVTGGHDGTNFLNSAEKYDLETKKWTNLPPMCEQRYVHSLAVLDGKLYACAGESRKSIEVYEPSTNSWQLLANMSGTRHGFLLIAHEGKLIAIRGKYEKSIEVYDPSENKWQINFELASGLVMDFPAGGIITSTYIPDVD